jgi:putative membrane protein
MKKLIIIATALLFMAGYMASAQTGHEHNNKQEQKQGMMMQNSEMMQVGMIQGGIMHGYDGHGWGMGWWWIIGLIILVAIVWMVIKGMNKRNSTHQSHGKPALDILKERYAKGEIDKQEFEERKKDLM